MRRRSPWLLMIAILSSSAPALAAVDCDPPPSAPRPEVAIQTVLGEIRIRLFDQPGEAPATVANFLSYAERGAYDDSFFHRLEPGFVLQGGAYTWDPVNQYQTITPDPPVVNEPNICNVRGTVAMAKISGQVNSATSQFFFNLDDNTESLGTSNGGFTVFAEVVPEDMAVLDQLAALHRESGLWLLDDPIAPALENLPVLEILERSPTGWGCIQSISPDPTYQPIVQQWWPTFVQTCADNVAFSASLDIAIADFAPQFPERLVMVHSVPEPGAALAVGAVLAGLAGVGHARRPRAATRSSS
jgi:cyclophilin family peptidyl-prolyl cis-trans isomerase